MVKNQNKRKKPPQKYVDDGAKRQKEFMRQRKLTHKRLNSLVEIEVKANLKSIALIKNMTETQVLEDLITSAYKSLWKRIDKQVKKLHEEGKLYLEIQEKTFRELGLFITVRDIESVLNKIDNEARLTAQKESNNANSSSYPKIRSQPILKKDES